MRTVYAVKEKRTTWTKLHVLAVLKEREVVRNVKVARTIADLECAEDLQPKHLSEAVQYRTLDRNLIEIYGYVESSSVLVSLDISARSGSA